MNFAKWLFFIGLGFILVSIVAYFFAKSGIPLGKLPGDIRFKGRKYGIYFPIITSIVISIVLTIVVNLFFYFFRK